MGIAISSRLLGRIMAEAAADPAREVCGLLLGDDGRIDDARAAVNVAPNSSSFFEVDPRMLFELIRAERAGGPRLVGHYHSHPGGVAEPSPHDAAAADGRLWLIVAGGRATLWRAVAGGPHLGAFEPIELVTEP